MPASACIVHCLASRVSSSYLLRESPPISNLLVVPTFLVDVFPDACIFLNGPHELRRRERPYLYDGAAPEVLAVSGGIIAPIRP